MKETDMERLFLKWWSGDFMIRLNKNIGALPNLVCNKILIVTKTFQYRTIAKKII